MIHDRCRMMPACKESGGNPWFLPGCMGGAVYGMRGCTCSHEQAEKTFEGELDKLKRRVKELEAAVKRLEGKK